MILASFNLDVDFNGIVVFAYPDLLRFFGGRIETGRNILEAFTTTALGEAVLDAGVVVPIVNLDDGGYRVRLLDAAPAEPARRQVVFSDAGYALRVTQELFVTDVAVFWDWEDRLGWTKVDIAPGAYAVTVQGVRHLDEQGAVEATGFDLILEPRAELPRRTAAPRADSRV
jgi:hypothetical protein